MKTPPPSPQGAAPVSTEVEEIADWIVEKREGNSDYQRHFAITNGGGSGVDIARLYFTKSPVDDELDTQYKADRIAKAHNTAIKEALASVPHTKEEKAVVLEVCVDLTWASWLSSVS